MTVTAHKWLPAPAGTFVCDVTCPGCATVMEPLVVSPPRNPAVYATQILLCPNCKHILG